MVMLRFWVPFNSKRWYVVTRYTVPHTQKCRFFGFAICLLASLLDNDTGGHVSASLNGFTNCTSTHEVIIIIKKSEIKYRDNDAYLVTELVEIVLFCIVVE